MNFKSGQIVFGAPGFYDFLGTIIKYIDKRQEPLFPLDRHVLTNQILSNLRELNSYTGYAVTSISIGNFEYVVASAPRSFKYKGMVRESFNLFSFYKYKGIFN